MLNPVVVINKTHVEQITIPVIHHSPHKAQNTRNKQILRLSAFEIYLYMYSLQTVIRR